jgi:hypothetical protein
MLLQLPIVIGTGHGPSEFSDNAVTLSYPEIPDSFLVIRWSADHRLRNAVLEEEFDSSSCFSKIIFQ